MIGHKPSRLARIMTVPALLNAARPAAELIGLDPPTRARRLVQTEVLPSVAVARVLQDAAECASGPERVLECPSVVTLDLADASLLDEKRLAGPELAPALAWRMTDHRIGAAIVARIASLV